jgi:hypothetical protein
VGSEAVAQAEVVATSAVEDTLEADTSVVVVTVAAVEPEEEDKSQPTSKT